MFGQSTFGVGGGFGAPSAAAPAFGAAPAAAPAWGAAPAAPAAFGQAPAAQPAFGGGGFGAAPVAQPAFGAAPTGFGAAPAAQPAFGGGGFGAAAASPAATGFGGFGATPTATNTFASPATGGSLFGAPSPVTPFGAVGGGFGAVSSPLSQPAFGATPTANTSFGFGGAAASPAHAFGAPSPAAPAFGAQAAASPFGAPAAAPAAFGATPGGFGMPQQQAAVGGFGAPQLGGQVIGSGNPPYKPLETRDPASNTTTCLLAITATAPYDAKSFEELRHEDYAAGKKGGQQAAAASGAWGTPAQPAAAPAWGAPAPAPAAFGFAAPAPAAGVFGAPAAAPAFGAPALGGFGAPAPAPAFGTPAPGAFGTSPGGFGAPAAAPAPAAFGFGAPAASPAPASGGFGGFGTPAAAPAPGGFGMPAAAPAAGGFGGFGASPAAAPASTAFGFGAPAAAPAPAAGFAGFGTPAAAPAPGAFGAPAAGGFGGFGVSPAPAPAAFGFGAVPAAAPAPSAFGFGAPAAAPAPAAGGFAGFGAAAAPAAAFSAFASPQPAFGAAPAAALPPAAAQPAPTYLTSQATAVSQDPALVGKLAMVENLQASLALVSGTAPPSSLAPPPSSLSTPDPYNTGSAAQSSSALRSYMNSSSNLSRVRPRFGNNILSPAASSHAADPRSPYPTSLLSPDAYLGNSTKRLVIKQGALTPSKISKNTMRLTLGSPPPSNNPPNPPALQAPPANPSPVADPAVHFSPPPPTTNTTPSALKSNPSYTSTPTPPTQDFYNQVVGSPSPMKTSAASHVVDDDDDDEDLPPSSGNPDAPTMTNPDYSVSPPIAVLASMSSVDLATLPNFRISNEFGSISWVGAVDVRGADLDKIVEISDKEVAVYDSYEEQGEKPPIGTALNRPAIIELQGIFAETGDTERFERKLVRQTTKSGADYISYDADAGVWAFKTHHFSRYGLYDSDSEEDAPDTKNLALAPPPPPPPPPAAPPVRLATPTAIVEGVDDGVMRRANDAYAKLLVAQTYADPTDMLPPLPSSPSSSLLALPPSTPSPTPPTWAELNDLTHRRFNANGACARARASLNMSAKPSLRDAHSFMGRSHAACITPDGRVISISGTHVNRLTIAPLPSVLTDSNLLDLFLDHATEEKGATSECPTFSLPSETSEIIPALDTYIQHTPDDATFPLIHALFGCDPGSPQPSEAARLQAFNNWLAATTLSSVKALVDSSIAMKPNLAVFQALTCGSVSYAAKIAGMAECHRLSLILTSGQNDQLLNDQLAKWSASGALELMDANLVRVYSALAGRGDVEDSAYEMGGRDLSWLRRLALGSLSTKNSSPAQVYHEYAQAVKDGKTPPPSSGERMLLRILGLTENKGSARTSSVVGPRGYGDNTFDYEAAFHTAAVLIALGAAAPMTLDEAMNMSSSYASSLTVAGDYEHAVVAVLASSSFVGAADKEACREASVSLAKEIVMRYSDGGSDFLIRAGVPEAWFHEALALKALSNGELSAHVHHLVLAGDIAGAVSSSSMLIAHSLLNNKHESLHALLADMASALPAQLPSWHAENGPGAVLAFFELRSQIEAVLNTEQARDAASGSGLGLWSENQVEGLIEAADDLMTKIVVKPPASYNLTYAELALSKGKGQQLLSAAFAELRSKLMSMKLLLTILANSGDVMGEEEGVDALGGVSERIVKCLRVGGRVDLGGSLEDVERAAFRGIASQMILGM